MSDLVNIVPPQSVAFSQEPTTTKGTIFNKSGLVGLKAAYLLPFKYEPLGLRWELPIKFSDS